MDHEGLIELIRGLPKEQLTQLIASMSPQEKIKVLDAWPSIWAEPHQRMPDLKLKWRRWVLRCGRGAGKGFAAAKTVNMLARNKRLHKNGEIGIIARTYGDVRRTCIEGPSGILATCSRDFIPTWSPGIGQIRWPNGVIANVYSGDKPEQLRGPNFSLIWADEISFWPDPDKVWFEAIEPALRLGIAAAIVTTTPRPGDKFLKKIEALSNTIVSRASTFDNPHLSDDVKDSFRAHMEGTRLGAQEMYGDILEDAVGALWTTALIDQHRVSDIANGALRRIVVAIDPAATNKENSDETGIVVVGIDAREHVYVLEDASGKYPAHGEGNWGEKAIGLYEKYKADRIVAEVNNGGDMVEAIVRAHSRSVAYSGVHASRGKVVRAEPVAALYEHGKVHHCGGKFAKLENQMTTWTPQAGYSPDRMDALVWGVTHLALANAKKPVGPLYG